MTMRWLVKLHLYTGLAAAAFVVIAALSGSVLVFADDYDRWLHPSLWNVVPREARIDEQQLVTTAQRLLAARGLTAPLEQIDLGDASTAQVLSLSDGTRAFIDPYRASINGIRDGATTLERFVTAVRQLHIRLMAGDRGEWAVDVATAALLFLVLSGFCLWLRAKRLRVRFGGSSRRTLRDFHDVLGIYGAAFVLLLSATGLFLAFEKPLTAILGAKVWRVAAVPHSVNPDRAGAAVPPPAIDQFIARAESTLPGSRAIAIGLPMRPKSPVSVLTRGPGLFGRNTVYLDRYTGAVLRVDDFRKLPAAYRTHVIDRAMHTGSFGAVGKGLMFLSSLCVALLAITGTVTWWQRVSRAPSNS
jgi:sulfite reductase (NADPH) flavoprotein alpha-component